MARRAMRSVDPVWALDSVHTSFASSCPFLTCYFIYSTDYFLEETLTAARISGGSEQLMTYIVCCTCFFFFFFFLKLFLLCYLMWCFLSVFSVCSELWACCWPPAVLRIPRLKSRRCAASVSDSGVEVSTRGWNNFLMHRLLTWHLV